MAVVVPVLMAVAGAEVATIAVVSLALSVTGVNDKINAAASDVFGEDLVGVANMFGSVYNSFSGGAGMFGNIDQAATAGDYVNAMDAASDAVTNAGEFGSLASMAPVDEAVGTVSANAFEAGAPMDLEAQDLVNQADAIEQMGGDRGDFLNGLSEQSMAAEGLVSDPMAAADATGQTQSLLPTEGAASTQAAGDPTSTGASTQQAARPQAAGAVKGPGSVTSPTTPQSAANSLNGSDVMSDSYRPGPSNNGQGGFGAKAGAGAGGRSFFERLIYDKDGNVSSGALRMGGQILGGIGNAYSEHKKIGETKRQFDARMAEERRQRSQLTGVFQRQ